MPRNQTRLIVASGLLALALGIVAALGWRGMRGTQLESATLLSPPRSVPEFLLTDHDGGPFTKAALSGRWTLMFPGFASCPDVCPATLAMLKDLEPRLAAAGHPLRIVFLSVDPERDDAARLKAYVGHFNPRFLGVTAPEPELGKVAQSMGIAYVKVPAAEDPKSYTVDHSAALLLFNPRAEIAAYFLAPHNADVLARDLERAIEAGA